jgi:hypothetical protein
MDQKNFQPDLPYEELYEEAVKLCQEMGLFDIVKHGEYEYAADAAWRRCFGVLVINTTVPANALKKLRHRPGCRHTHLCRLQRGRAFRRQAIRDREVNTPGRPWGTRRNSDSEIIDGLRFASKMGNNK